MRSPALLTAFAVVLLSPACLEEQRGGAVDTTPDATPDATSDGAADASPDATQIDATPSEVVDPCADIDCDDGEQCTIDTCLDGVCSHVTLQDRAPPDGYPEPPECLQDAECDDGDACTIDTCVVRLDNCGLPAWAHCAYVELDRDGCTSSRCDDAAVAACADGDPCTIDGCDPQLGCTSTPIGNGLCEPACAVGKVVPLSSIPYAVGVGASFTTAGEVGMAPTICPLCAGCPCTGAAQITELEHALALLGAEAPTCTSDGTGTVCEPLQHAVRYLVWGKAMWQERASDGGVGVPNAIALAGYCLDTSAPSVAGDYDASLRIESDEVLRFTARLALDSAGGLTMNISDVVPLPQSWVTIDVAAFARQNPAIETSDEGRLRVSLALPWVNGTPEIEVVHLFARQSSLVGTIGPLLHSATSPDGDGAPPPREDTLPYGDLRLERRAP